MKNEIAISESNIFGGQESDVCDLLGIHKDTKQSLPPHAYWTLSGRATRREYWVSVLPAYVILLMICTIVVCCAVSAALSAISSGRGNYLNLGWYIFTVVFFVLLFKIGTFPVTVRRLHDRNMSGWFLLVFFVCSLIPFVSMFAWVVELIIVGCLDGTVGPNEFGPDPKGRKPIQAQFIVPPSSVASHESPEDRLFKLQKLKEAGIVSEEEYEEKRRKMLVEI